MWRKRTKLRVVPDEPETPLGPARPLATLLPLLAGATVTVAVLRWLAARRRREPEDAGVLHAEVSSNGHSKVRLDSLEQFS